MVFWFNLPANIYLFKINNRDTRKRGEICSKLKITPERHHSGVFIVNFEHIFSSVSIVELQEQFSWATFIPSSVPLTVENIG